MPARRVFDTRGASEEELAGVREALDSRGIDWYETESGNWGFGNAALWVRDERDFDAAREQIDAFQKEWRNSVRQNPEPAGIRWHRVPALIAVVALIIWVFSRSFQW